MVKDAPQAVREWLRLYDDLRQVLARLLSSFYVPSIFEDHRVTNLAQAAEGLHKERWDHPSRDPSEHHDRVEIAINPEAPKGVRNWAKNVLNNANQLSLRVRVLELVNLAVQAGMPMAPQDSSTFGRAVSEGRNRPSHGGGLIRGNDLDQLHRTFQALEWILKVLLPSLIGASADDIAYRLSHDADFTSNARHLEWQPVARPPSTDSNGLE